MDNVEKRLIRCFVLLSRQYLLLDYIVQKRKQEVLSSFEAALEKKSQTINNVLAVYDLAFSIVDNIVRYQKIADMLPRFNQRSPEHRLFEARLSGIKDLRNLLQHLSRDFESEFESPVLGGIAWVNNDMNYIAAFNDPTDKRKVPGLVFDTEKMKYTKEFCYVHDGVYYDLDKAIMGCFDYQAFVETKCQVQVNDKEYRVEDHFIAGAFGFQKNPKAE